MKKILLGAACLVAVAAAGFGGYTYYENQQMDPWLKANIAAISQNEGGSNYLNGPQKGYDCPGWFTGRGFRCAAEIATNCNEILCK